MPRKYPSYQTCRRRFKVWYESGVLKRVMDQLYGDASVELCEMMQARMRTHNGTEESGENAQALPPKPPVIKPPAPAQVKPLPSSSFNYTSPFKYAA